MGGGPAYPKICQQSKACDTPWSLNPQLNRFSTNALYFWSAWKLLVNVQFQLSIIPIDIVTDWHSEARKNMLDDSERTQIILGLKKCATRIQ